VFPSKCVVAGIDHVAVPDDGVIEALVAVYFLVPEEDTAAVTNAVVAICVVFVPAVAVGAVGVPVNAGLVSDLFVSVSVEDVVTMFTPSIATTPADTLLIVVSVA
jgi:hypothetical protein